MNNKNKGILLILISSLFGAITLTLIKLGGNIPVYEKSFLRNVCTIMISFYALKKANDNAFGKKGSRKILILRAICGTLSVWTSYYAISHMIIANATVLTKLSPIITIVFASIFLKERIKNIHIVAFIIAFVGVIFVVNPTGGHYDILPSLMAIGSAFLAAGVATCLRFLRGKESANTIVFFYAFVSMISSVPLMLIHFKIPTISEFLILLLSGLSSTVTQFSITKAYKYAKASEISIYNYSSIIFITILGYLVWGTIPSEGSFLGYILIVIGAIIIFLIKNKE
ncbi:MAG: DMT family transporter [Romboutsia sp.]|uniref:DMT family transporter n=1 Tax=Romboutsia sp. TaxID=1965302 RepID=UPI003F2FF244